MTQRLLVEISGFYPVSPSVISITTIPHTSLSCGAFAVSVTLCVYVLALGPIVATIHERLSDVRSITGAASDALDVPILGLALEIQCLGRVEDGQSLLNNALIVPEGRHHRVRCTNGKDGN